jgi:outer membrane protein assembly factor BamD
MGNFFRNSVFILLAIVSLACSDFQKVLKSESIDEKYQAAIKYYEKKDYYRAGLLFEELMPIMKGRAEAEQAHFIYANCHFEQSQYMLAAYYYRTFAETYPRSPLTEQATYMQARSLYYDSPRFNLDQTSTKEAMDAIQGFLSRYETSKFVPAADSMYQDLSVKLERKAYENAKLYYNVRHYKSAVVAFTNFARDYPSSAYLEEISFLKLEAQHSLASQSVPEKQLERYDEVVDFYLRFVDKYPKSKYLKPAEAFYVAAQAEVQRLKTVTNAQQSLNSKQ